MESERMGRQGQGETKPQTDKSNGERTRRRCKFVLSITEHLVCAWYTRRKKTDQVLLRFYGTKVNRTPRSDGGKC